MKGYYEYNSFVRITINSTIIKLNLREGNHKSLTRNKAKYFWNILPYY